MKNKHSRPPLEKDEDFDKNKMSKEQVISLNASEIGLKIKKLEDIIYNKKQQRGTLNKDIKNLNDQLKKLESQAMSQLEIFKFD